jgi:hypothetical protein
MNAADHPGSSEQRLDVVRFGLSVILTKFRIDGMLSQKDFWVGKAISQARIAYETWIELQSGKIKIEPESSPNHFAGGYVNLFINYAKAAFLNAVAVLDRGFFEYKDGVFVKNKKVACRMLEFVPEDQIEELRKLTAPLRTLRNKDQHIEDPNKLPVWSTQVTPAPPTIGTSSGDHVDPSPLYELLKSLEPSIGYIAFYRAVSKRANSESATGSDRSPAT